MDSPRPLFFSARRMASMQQNHGWQHGNMSFVLVRFVALQRIDDGAMNSALRRKLRAMRAMERARPEDAVDLAPRPAHLRLREGVEQPAHQRWLRRRETARAAAAGASSSRMCEEVSACVAMVINSNRVAIQGVSTLLYFLFSCSAIRRRWRERMQDQEFRRSRHAEK